MTRFATIALLAVVAGCTPEAEAPSASDIEWRSLETGRACATAQVACGVGNCAARIDNGCDEAVTCELTVQCICRSLTSEEGEALARASETVAERARGGMRAHVLCAASEVLTTHAQALRCE